MDELGTALLAAASVPLCSDCIVNEGLCIAHIPHVCPQLKEPSWYRDAHAGMYHEVRKDLSEQDTATKKARRRNERRLIRAQGGEFTRTRRKAA